MFEIGRDKETRERNEEIEILRNENEITKNKQREIERRKSKGDEGELRQLNEEIERLRNQNQIEFNKLKEKERNEIEIFKNRQNEFLRNAAEVQVYFCFYFFVFLTVMYCDFFLLLFL